MSDAQTVYLIIGESGEYADQREWNAAAYTDRALAEQHVALLHAALGGAWQRLTNGEAHELSASLKSSGLDPQASLDYTGAEYHVEELPLRTQVPGAIGKRGRLSPLAS